jgi:hypothetical protein
MSSKDKDSSMSRFEELDPDQYANWKSTKDSIIYSREESKRGLRAVSLTAARSAMSRAANALEGLDRKMTSLCQSWVNVKLETLKYNKSGQKRARISMEQVSASEDSESGSQQEVVSVTSETSEDDGVGDEYEDEESDGSSASVTELDVTTAVAKVAVDVIADLMPAFVKTPSYEGAFMSLRTNLAMTPGCKVAKVVLDKAFEGSGDDVAEWEANFLKENPDEDVGGANEDAEKDFTKVSSILIPLMEEESRTADVSKEVQGMLKVTFKNFLDGIRNAVEADGKSLTVEECMVAATGLWLKYKDTPEEFST